MNTDSALLIRIRQSLIQVHAREPNPKALYTYSLWWVFNVYRYYDSDSLSLSLLLFGCLQWLYGAQQCLGDNKNVIHCEMYFNDSWGEPIERSRTSNRFDWFVKGAINVLESAFMIDLSGWLPNQTPSASTVGWRDLIGFQALSTFSKRKGLEMELET